MAEIPVQGAPERRGDIEKSFFEQPMPSKSALLEDFSEKRNTLHSTLDDLNQQNDGPMDPLQRERCRKKIRETQVELDEFNAFWAQIGGERVDDAQAVVDGLNFKSSTSDRIQARGTLREAEDALYDNFVELHDQMSQEELGASDDTKQKAEAEAENETELPSNEREHLSDEEIEKLSEIIARAKGQLSEEEIAQLKQVISSDTESGLSEEEVSALQDVIDRHQSANDETTAGESLSPEEIAALNQIINDAKDKTTSQESEEDPHDAQRAQIVKEFENTRVGQLLQLRLDTYAERKADLETRGDVNPRFWKVGRRKREKALREAEEQLAKAQAEYVKKLIGKYEQASFYEGNGDERAQAISDDYFNEFSKLGMNAARAAREERLNRQENRNFVQKGLVAVGKFLNGAKKGGGWFRNAGTGAVAGAAVATGAVLSGVGWPITALVGVGARQGTRYGATADLLDKNLSKDIDEVLSEDEMNKQLSAMKEEGMSRDDQVAKLSDEMFRRLRERGDEELKAAREEATRHARQFMIGYAAAGVAVHAMDWLASSGDSVVHAAAGSSSGNSSQSVLQGGTQDSGRAWGDMLSHHGSGSASVDTVTQHNFEFPSGASHIDLGEGWYHQFGDMGLTQDQAHALFNDPDLMNKLVNQGVAYVDNSSTIGGYGISMPSNGELPAQAMDTIRQAAIAKGYVN